MKKSIMVTMMTILIMSICSQVFALNGIGIDPKPEIGGGGSTIASNIIGIMQWVGYAIAVGIMVYVGIKYVTSSADDRASLKGAAWKYILGAVLITGAVTIADWIFNGSLF